MTKPLLVLTALAALSAPFTGGGPQALATSPLEAGHFEASRGATCVVVAAPHGGFDLESDTMARQVALTIGAGYLLATGFRTFDHPWNVNRPTAGVGLKEEDEARTPEAQQVYEAYAQRLKQLAPCLYVEIHGNNRRESAGQIETATVNIQEGAARAFQADFRTRVAALDASYPRFDLKIEPLDAIHFRATSTKAQGVFTLVPRAVHLETPKAMRTDERVRSRYAWILAECVDDLACRLQRR
jgi:hypothetical protein